MSRHTLINSAYSCLWFWTHTCHCCLLTYTRLGPWLTLSPVGIPTTIAFTIEALQYHCHASFSTIVLNHHALAPLADSRLLRIIFSCRHPCQPLDTFSRSKVNPTHMHGCYHHSPYLLYQRNACVAPRMHTLDDFTIYHCRCPKSRTHSNIEVKKHCL